MRWIHRGLLLLGAVTFASLLRWVGAERLWLDARELGWGMLALFLVAGLEHGLHTAAWQRCFPPQYAPRLLTLLPAFLAGQAVNRLTPTASVGGEVARAGMLADAVPEGPRIASLAADRLSLALADMAIGSLGLAVLLRSADTAGMRLGLALAAALLALGVGAFLVLQRRGATAAWLRGPDWQRWIGDARARRLVEATERIDGALAELHREHGGRFLTALSIHFSGTLVQCVQLAIFLHFIGVPVDATVVVSTFAAALAIDLFSFLVPGRLGAHEAGRVLAFQATGLDPAHGLLFALAIRLEQLTWDGVGLACYALRSRAPAARARPSGS